MIYIHIPFCKQACHYCDFHFVTNLKKKGEYLKCLEQEMELQKSFFDSPESKNRSIKTLYFGGGTPSLLEPSEIEKLLDSIRANFDVAKDCEITLEANPDDLKSKVYLKDLQKVGVNRLSIGIQSFNEEHLQFMNRAHTAKEATECVRNAQDVGIENISIDLIYGVALPDRKLTHDVWQSDLEKALSLDVPHISSYCLTIEPRTTFANWVKRSKMKNIDDEFAAQQFEMLVQTLTKNGYEHYEISNFAKPNHYSKHNTAYWQDKPYLGLGASAHSYDGKDRFINVANNRTYMEALQNNELAQTKDELSKTDKINEYILTSLRTMWGLELNHLIQKYDYNLLSHQQEALKKFEQNYWIIATPSHIRLTQEGKLFADGIASDLFLT